MLRILIVEGNEKALRDKSAAAGTLTQGELYQKTLESLADDLECTIVFPADVDAVLPEGNDFSNYDGIVWTGSALNIYDRGPSIDGQIEFMKTCFEEKTRMFGSCWGLQVAVEAAGGEVSANEKGRQIGIAREIGLTEAGKSHPLYKDKPDVFDAVNIHLDHTSKLPEGAVVLSRNDKSEVQGVEIKRGKSIFWGVQYHPEFDLEYMADLIKRYEPKLIAEGICETKEDVMQWAEDFARAEQERSNDLASKYGLSCDVLDPASRLRELSNWLNFLRPEKSASAA